MSEASRHNGSALALVAYGDAFRRAHESLGPRSKRDILTVFGGWASHRRRIARGEGLLQRFVEKILAVLAASVGIFLLVRPLLSVVVHLPGLLSRGGPSGPAPY